MSNVVSEPLPKHGMKIDASLKHCHSRWPRPEISIRTISESNKFSSNTISEHLSEHGQEINVPREILTAGGPDQQFQYDNKSNKVASNVISEPLAEHGH